MAKVDLRAAEIDPHRVALGQCIDRARMSCHWNLDQFTAAIGKQDARQVARWISGAERPHLDALMSVPEFWREFVIELAKLDPRFEVVSEIRIRRIA
jgi:hypothetical protein